MSCDNTEPQAAGFSAKNKSSNQLQRFLEELGPGIITGAADDDPSGISTYSVAGASFGYTTLWTTMSRSNQTSGLSHAITAT
jgi:Mn2+/Fe2+ NRAMP family transporter